jgi:FkbM family methyltransferase
MGQNGCASCFEAPITSNGLATPYQQSDPQIMNTTLMQTAAHSLGAMRVGRHSIPGQGRLVDALGKVAYWLNGSTGVASLWPGVKFETDLKDRIQRQMWAGTYEPHVRECFTVLLEEGNVYLDVGGHIGYHSVFASFKVGASGQVFAFEADPEMYGRLAKNLAQFSWAHAIHAAVWSTTGEITFERSHVKCESGWGTVCMVRDLGSGEHLNVHAVSLDDWIQSINLTRWDAMKLDAEGSELAVLRGARNSLEKFSPTLILEINDPLLREAGTSSSEVAEFLIARGYRLFLLSHRKLTNRKPSQDDGYSDVIGLPGNRVKELIERLGQNGFELVL